MMRMRLLPVLVAFLAAATLSGCAAVVVAGAAGGVMVAAERRQADVVVADERIEITAATRIRSALDERGHVNVTSFNRVVLLTGEATTDALRAEAERIAVSVPEVRKVVNEIQIKAPSWLTARSGDAITTSQVKSRMLGSDKFSSLHVKVVTEAGVVYLMGLVTPAEADAASDVARTTAGVAKVVRVFEYIPEPPPAQESKAN